MHEFEGQCDLVQPGQWWRHNRWAVLCVVPDSNHPQFIHAPSHDCNYKHLAIIANCTANRSTSRSTDHCCEVGLLWPTPGSSMDTDICPSCRHLRSLHAATSKTVIWSPNNCGDFVKWCHQLSHTRWADRDMSLCLMDVLYLAAVDELRGQFHLYVFGFSCCLYQRISPILCPGLAVHHY